MAGLVPRLSTRAVCLVLATLTGLCLAANASKTTRELVLEEQFGIAHPDQIVLFDAPAKRPGKATVLVDGQGQPVVHQITADGRVAICTDLPAGATRRWSWQTGKRAASNQQTVRVQSRNGFYEITNHLIGVRISKPTNDLQPTPAPIQGLRYQDGTWTATGPNWMDRPAKSMTVRFLDRGPLIVRIQVGYIYDRAKLRAQFEKEVIPAGEGPYASTITIQAGQPSILIEEYSEVEIGYTFDVTSGLQPNRGQYRGHHSTSVADGRDAKGGQYGAKRTGAGVVYCGSYGRQDALVELDRPGPRLDRWSGSRFPFMSHWDPWAVNTGYYWQLYATDRDNDNLLGIFSGRPSRLIGPGLTGVSIDTRPHGTTDPAKRYAGVRLKMQRLMPTQHYARKMRFGWGIFLGRKSKDLKPPTEVQGIGRQLNLHSGINLTKLHSVSGDYPDPARGYGSIYAPARVWQHLAKQLRDEQAAGRQDLYRRLATDGNLHPFLHFWRKPTRAEALKHYSEIVTFAKRYVETVVNGSGLYTSDIVYFMGSMRFARRLVMADQLLASDLLSKPQQRKLKTALVLFATMLWDHDQAPMHTEAKVNLGPANMSAMWLGTRYTFTLFLAQHPAFRERVKPVKDRALELLGWYVNEHGACTASAHYTTASMVPILNLLQQLQASGVYDAFAAEPKLKRYAEWDMQLTTPPEVRFGGRRKIIPVGDGSTEFSSRPGQLATGFAKADPELSARLMRVWESMGSPHSSFYGTSTLKIDSTLPSQSPDLGSARFEGWFSVLRRGWGSPDETAVFFIAGDTLTDHRHNDMGSVIIYALGVPLSTDWGPIYYPRVAGGMMHSTVTPEFLLKRPWHADNTPLNLPAGGGGRAHWWHTKHRPLVVTSTSATTSASFQLLPRTKDVAWSRTVRLLHEYPAHPIVVIDDRFTGADAGRVPMIATLNLMARGPVTTPVGPVTPVRRIYNWRDKKKQELPSAGKPIKLTAALNRFRFTGQWGVDFDLVIDADEPTEVTIGNWAHTWCPSTEQREFRLAHKRPFEERQHILRVRGAKHMRTIILPYRHGRRPDPFEVRREQNKLTVRIGSKRIGIGAR